MSDTHLTLLTGGAPGAVAILQLTGDGAVATLEALTGKPDWQPGVLRVCRFADIDEGLAVVLPGPGPMTKPGPDSLLEPRSIPGLQLMPHGGPRVVRRLIGWLTQRPGVVYQAAPDPMSVYPEAASRIEADLLAAIASAASPAAIDLLADQPAQWAALLSEIASNPQATETKRQAIAVRSAVLDQLLDPPAVVVVGPANVGKSTLTNTLMGRLVSIVADLPGTTRDWVGGLVELSPGIAVRWLDTPGLRESEDAIEQRAIGLAQRIMDDSRVLIAMRDPDQDWPDAAALPRQPDVWVMNKADRVGGAGGSTPVGAGQDADHPLAISAEHGRGLDQLQALIVDRLGLSDLTSEPWAFSPRLRAWCDESDQDLDGYLLHKRF